MRLSLSPPISTSPTHLLNQTQSFGAFGDGESAGAEAAGGGQRQRTGADDVRAAEPQWQATAGSLDGILDKARTAPAAENNVTSAASGGAAGAATPNHSDESATGAAAAAGGSRARSAAETTPKKKRGSLDDIMGIKADKAVKGNTKKVLQEGDAVEIMTPLEDGGPSAFSPGVISHVHADGRVDVDLGMGTRLMQRPAKELRVVRKWRSSVLSPGDLAVGDRVEAR